MTEGDRPKVIESVLRFVEQNYTSPISLRDVAHALGYSASHLTDTFRRSTGTPVTAWIIRRRMQAAAELIRDSGISVATACESVGYNDLGYFTRQFARHVGMTPGRYRRTVRAATLDGEAERYTLL
ncbi:MAG TPA: AraC family transcriptional regulator [Candidatus Elarobacter sp.]|jgi:AraC-like DNA-binding protein